jgi:alpha-mannosidase
VQDASDAASYRRYLAQRVNDPLILTFGKAPDNSSSSGAAAAAGQPTTLAAASRSFLADPDGLPGSVQLVTLKDNGDGRVLLRLAHVYQVRCASASGGFV